MRPEYAKYVNDPRCYIDSVECMKNEVDMLFVASGLFLENLIKRQKRNFNGGLGNSNGIEVIKSLKPVKILDVCCGPGNFSNYISLVSEIRVTGIDTNEGFVKYANKRFSKFGWKFLVRDAVSFKLDKKFDFVIANSAYHHIIDAQKAGFLIQIRKHLKRDGRVILCDNFLPYYQDRRSKNSSINKFYKELRLFYSRQNSLKAKNSINDVLKEELYGNVEHKVHFGRFRKDAKKAGLEIETDIVVWQPEKFRQDESGSHVLVLK